MADVFTGNKREVPPDMPVLFWRDLVLETENLSELHLGTWYHSAMESLNPGELRRIRAKALVWRNTTGDWPDDISCWWEIRMARRRGDLPHSEETATATIDEDGVLVCGKCGARWSAAFEDGDHPERCTLCDAGWIVISDERIPVLAGA